MLRFSLVFAASVLCFLPIAGAAPCCASKSVAPALITGDDRLQVTATSAWGTVIGDAPDSGMPVFRAQDDSEITRSLRIDAATIVSDRSQVAIGVPVLFKTVSRPGVKNSATGLGDVSLGAAYEAIPEWSYSAWRPKGFVFMQIVAPTGRSLHDSKEVGAVDAMGQGFWSPAVGAVFTKSWRSLDVYAMPEAHYSFPRTFGDSGATVSPGFGTSLALGFGYSPWGREVRAGARIQPSFNQAHLIEENGEASWAGSRTSWDVAVEMGYLASMNWSILASYVDQTLIGPAKNSTLSRTFSFGIQRRWER